MLTKRIATNDIQRRLKDNVHQNQYAYFQEGRLTLGSCVATLFGARLQTGEYFLGVNHIVRAIAAENGPGAQEDIDTLLSGFGNFSIRDDSLSLIALLGATPRVQLSILRLPIVT